MSNSIQDIENTYKSLIILYGASGAALEELTSLGDHIKIGEIKRAKAALKEAIEKVEEIILSENYNLNCNLIEKFNITGGN